MIKRIRLFGAFKMALFALLLSAGMMGQAAELDQPTATTLHWEELIPKEALEQYKKQPPAVVNHDGEPTEQQQSPSLTAVKKELNGQFIKLAGYMVPLDGNNDKVTVFLLVPYFGACIHVPPPPANQIVYVEYPEGVSADIIYDPVWIIGAIEAGIVESEMAVSGYKMTAAKVELYTETQ